MLCEQGVVTIRLLLAPSFIITSPYIHFYHQIHVERNKI